MRNRIKHFVTAASLGAIMVGGLFAPKGVDATERGSYSDCRDTPYRGSRIFSCAGDQYQAAQAVVLTYKASSGLANLCEWTGAGQSCGSYVTITSDAYMGWAVPVPSTRGGWPEVHVLMPNLTPSVLVGFIIAD